MTYNRTKHQMPRFLHPYIARCLPSSKHDNSADGGALPDTKATTQIGKRNAPPYATPRGATRRTPIPRECAVPLVTVCKLEDRQDATARTPPMTSGLL